jgi:alkylhydroperoxidase family enzyme
MGIRSAVALREGLDEPMIAKVWDYESSDLSPRRKTALRLADAYLIGMGHVPDELRREAAAELTPAEIFEIGILLFKSMQNKVRIALGTDAAEVSIQVTAPAD